MPAFWIEFLLRDFSKTTYSFATLNHMHNRFYPAKHRDKTVLLECFCLWGGVGETILSIISLFKKCFSKTEEFGASPLRCDSL